MPGSLDLMNLGLITVSDANAQLCFTPEKTIDVTVGLDADAMGSTYEDLTAKISIGGYIPYRLPGSIKDLPFGTVALDTGSFRLPGGSIQLPDGTFQLPTIPVGLGLPGSSVCPMAPSRFSA